MHVSFYLFLAFLFIHDMNNALNMSQMEDQEQRLQASIQKKKKKKTRTEESIRSSGSTPMALKAAHPPLF